MQPIIGETSYPEMAPEEIKRHLREAEQLRAEAIRHAGRACARFAVQVVRRSFAAVRHLPSVRGAHS